MGRFVDGTWTTQPAARRPDGRFVRPVTQFRDRITASQGRFQAEAGRYHLYVSYACPWASRTLIVRELMALTDVIDVSVLHPDMGDDSWTFAHDPADIEGPTGDLAGEAKLLGDVYLRADAKYTGRVTVPVLWDRRERTIVNNESVEIIEMFNREFDAFTDVRWDLCPDAERDAMDGMDGMDGMDARIYETVNNGVYRAGFAGSQAAYEEAFDALFETLDMLEQRLATRRYLCGARLTASDLRLFTTLVRFDPVYHTHFKCNLRRLIDYDNLWGYTRELYQIPAIKRTVRMDHIKRHYYRSHESISPRRIIARGPLIDFDAPHGRGHLEGDPHVEALIGSGTSP